MANVNNSEQEEMQILKNIERLQTMEKALYKQLEGSTDDQYMKSVGSYPYTLGGGGYTFEQAKEVCASNGGQLCNKADIIDKDICMCGWTAEGNEGGYPMAHANSKTPGGCGGPTPGWRTCDKRWVPTPAAHCCKAKLSSGNVDGIVNRINQLSDVRMTLYKSLNYTYQSLQKTVNTSRSELVQLLSVVSIVEDELNSAKIHLNHLYGIKNNKMRMVEINTYYGKRYRAQSGIMKLIIFICVLLLVVSILRKKSLITDSISNILFGIIITLGIFFIIWRILDIIRRDNMNFDAYDYKFNPDEKEKIVGYKIPEIPKIDCIGNSCCTDGMIYNTDIRKCVSP
jgi:hypothetical protein